MKNDESITCDNEEAYDRPLSNSVIFKRKKGEAQSLLSSERLVHHNEGRQQHKIEQQHP